MFLSQNGRLFFLQLLDNPLHFSYYLLSSSYFGFEIRYRTIPASINFGQGIIQISLADLVISDEILVFRCGGLGHVLDPGCHVGETGLFSFKLELHVLVVVENLAEFVIQIDYLIA